MKCYYCSQEIKANQKHVDVAIEAISYPMHKTCFKIFAGKHKYIKSFGVYRKEK